MKNNVLMIIPNLTFGGAQQDFCKLANHLSKNHNVFVVAFEYCDIPFDLIPEPSFMQIKGGSNYVKKILNFIGRLRFIRKFKRNNFIDISISYLEGANYLNLLSKKNNRVIISARGSILHDETISGFIGIVRKKILIPLLYNRADNLVSLNNGIKAELDSMRVQKPEHIVIRNSYDVDKIEQQANQSLDPKFSKVFNDPVIITVGRLAIEKGYDHLLKIFKSVKNHVDNARLVIVGDGPEALNLIQLAKNEGFKVFSGIDSHISYDEDADVFFLGFEPNPYMYMGKANLFTLTSSSEGGPNVLSEAMLCRTFVLSADCPTGPRERIAPGRVRPNKPIDKIEVQENGVLLPVFDANKYQEVIELWSKTIIQYLNSESAENMKNSAYEYTMKNFSVSKVMTDWEDLISKR